MGREGWFANESIGGDLNQPRALARVYGVERVALVLLRGRSPNRAELMEQPPFLERKEASL